MDIDLKNKILDQFSLFRSRYDELEKYYEKKKRPLSFSGKLLTIKGESFFSHALMGQKFDFAYHNCGLAAYPEHLENNPLYSETDSCLNAIQQQILKEAFDKFIYKEDPFSYEFKNYRGLWMWGLSAETLERKVYMEYTGQYGDYLSLCVEDYFEIIEELFTRKEFKKIVIEEYDKQNVFSLLQGNFQQQKVSRNLDPLERRGEISNFFLKLLLIKHFVCDHFQEKICRLCGVNFWPQMVSEWPSRVPPDYCAICLEMAFSSSTDFFRLMSFSDQERRQNFVSGIKMFTDFFGFIPAVGTTKRRLITQLRRTGVSGEDLDLTLMASALLPWHETAKKLFGSWAHLLEEAQLLENQQRGRGGHRSFGSDGHLCLSMGERAICEFLTRKSISHDKEPMYPKDEKLNPHGGLRGDFLVGSIIIEFAGMMDNQEYAERMNQKKKLAKIKKIPWIKIEGSGLEDLNLMLEKIQSLSATPHHPKPQIEPV